ncbi:MAG: hypothetical protein N4A50_09380 [Vallitalea sp.]|jgi:hypothetical protein|nr:hypothetical protein [Vallitalea sp.]
MKFRRIIGTVMSVVIMMSMCLMANAETQIGEETNKKNNQGIKLEYELIQKSNIQSTLENYNINKSRSSQYLDIIKSELKNNNLVIEGELNNKHFYLNGQVNLSKQGDNIFVSELKDLENNFDILYCELSFNTSEGKAFTRTSTNYNSSMKLYMLDDDDNMIVIESCLDELGITENDLISHELNYGLDTNDTLWFTKVMKPIRVVIESDEVERMVATGDTVLDGYDYKEVLKPVMRASRSANRRTWTGRIYQDTFNIGSRKYHNYFLPYFESVITDVNSSSSDWNSSLKVSEHIEEDGVTVNLSNYMWLKNVKGAIGAGKYTEFTRASLNGTYKTTSNGSLKFDVSGIIGFLIKDAPTLSEAYKLAKLVIINYDKTKKFTGSTMTVDDSNTKAISHDFNSAMINNHYNCSGDEDNHYLFLGGFTTNMSDYSGTDIACVMWEFDVYSNYNFVDSYSGDDANHKISYRISN